MRKPTPLSTGKIPINLLIVQEFEQISTKEQNLLARLYPNIFDHIPETIPAPLLFGSDNYEIEDQVALEELLSMKGQEIQQVHEQGTEFNKQTVLSANYVTRRYKKVQAQKNFLARKRAGAVSDSALGIVGSNLDKGNTRTLQKETRAGLYRAQNMIQKIRLGIDVSEFEITCKGNTGSGLSITFCGPKSNTLWPCPGKFQKKALKRPIVSKNVCECGKPLGHVVELQRNREHGSSSVNGVATCKSVWSCPVCRTKIISERSDQLKEIYKKWKDRGGHVTMITLTVPHSKGDNLAELYGSNTQGTGITGALGNFRSSRHFSKDFKEQAGYFGDIRGVEVTWGRKNGFHPHIHLLILSDYTYDFKAWKNRFYIAWRDACKKAGLQEPSFEHGVDIQYCDDSEQAAYIAKWSAASELVSDGMKEARLGNFSIAELERCLWDSKFREQKKLGQKRAACVLRAYYGAMHGQRMLQMGGISKDHNWKKELLEISESKDPDSEKHDHICDLEYWEYIKIKRAGKLPDLLQATEVAGSRPQAQENARNWLAKNGFDPEAVKERATGPPPSCFSYPTDHDRGIQINLN